MIYYFNLQENHDDSTDIHDDDDDDDDLQPRTEDGCQSSSLALVNEARMLVNFLLYIASYSQLMPRQSSSTIQFAATTSTIGQSLAMSLWASVAQSLCIWTHYSDPFHAEVS